MLIISTIIMALIGKFLKDYPIKDINKFIGYRTKRSMANGHNWILAQKTAFEIMYKIYYIISLTFIPFIVIDVLSLIGKLNDTIFIGSLTIQAIITVFGFVIIYVYTENKLKVEGQN